MSPNVDNYRKDKKKLKVGNFCLHSKDTTEQVTGLDYKNYCARDK